MPIFFGIGGRPFLAFLPLVLACLGAGPAWADADEYVGLDWQPYSTAAKPCGIGLPPRGQFAHDLWLNERRPELSLTVKQDGTRLCYVANGLAEAPVIRARLGDTLTINLRNEITDPAILAKLLPSGKLETPNTAIPDQAGFVPVTPGMRHLPTGRTNLHVHGFAVPPIAPQDEVLMGCADPAVGPQSCGQRELTYSYKIPLTMPPGLYWYHPHVHGEVQAQMLAGLSGAIVIEGPDDAAREAAGIQDRVFVVRQEQDSDAGKMSPPTVAPADHGAPVTRVAPPAPRNPAIGGARIDTQHELGCTDAAAIDEISLNGAPVVDGQARDQDLAPLEIPQGATQLWRVLNAATDAFLDLALVDQDGANLPIRIIARDGAPLSDDAGKPRGPVSTTEAQLVPPAGRIEFLVTAPPVGRKVYLISHAVDTGCAGDRVPERKLALLTTRPSPNGVAAKAVIPPSRALPSLFSGLLAHKTDRQRVIAFAEYPRPGSDDQTDFYIFERRPDAVMKPFEMEEPPIITTPAGSVEEWEIENWTNEVHAFHIHQVHFRVLAVNGARQADTPLLDTVTVPAAAPADVTGADKVAPGRVRIKLAFPANLAGDIPFHCHLVDHEDNGMMGVLRVLPSGREASAVQKAELPDLSIFGRSAICGPAGTAGRSSTGG